MSKKYSLDRLSDIIPAISRPSLVFLYGDLWAGKTTISQSIIQKELGEDKNITSPTYVYYNKYSDIYHFDLYRCSDYDEFVSIWWEEILDNNEGIILVEWPQILKKYYTPDIEIYIEKIDDESDNRHIDLKYKKV